MSSQKIALSDNGTVLTFLEFAGERVTQYVFNSLTASTNPGAFVSQTDSNGVTTSVTSRTGSQVNEMQRSYTSDLVTTTESLLYTYLSSGTSAGKLQSVLHRRSTGSGWTPVQQVVYAYYGPSDLNGSTGDLQSASRQLPNSSSGWDTVAVDFYRYYIATGSGGYIHGVKLHFGPEAYRLIFNDSTITAAGGITAASDTLLLPYADHYFEYDSSMRVTKEVSSVCSSCPGGGTTSDVFAYSSNPRSPANGNNTWSTKTVQTLPDSSTVIVYANYAGQTMLYVTVDSTGTQKWMRYYRYDSNGNQIWKANPAAVNGYDDTYDDLMNVTGGTSIYLNSTGLIEVTNYHSSTGSGAANGYVSDDLVQDGQSGTPVYVRSYTYTSNTDSASVTIYPMASVIDYPIAGNTTTTITTSYSYAFQIGTNLIIQKTTTLPAVSSGQNGDSTAPTVVENYDTYGNLTSTVTQQSLTVFITNNYVYDPLMNVKTQQTLNYQSGVTVAGVNIVSNYQYDYLGRLVQTLGSSHTVVVSSGSATSVRPATWMVYIESVQPSSTSVAWDVNQTWTGQGYATGTGPSYTFTLVDPVGIAKTDKDGRTTDSIASKRTSGSGALSPTDTFLQGDWRSWLSKQYNPQHQKISSRMYFAIPSSGTGSSGTNYAETDYGYDVLERLNRVVAPGGTITRTVWTTPQWMASTWVGTDDTGATDSNPAGFGSPNNMVQVTANHYDGGGIGDGTLTQVTQYVSATSGDTRVTGYGYDFRDRRTSMTDATSRYTVYTIDNLDRQTQSQAYATNGGNLIAQSQTNYDDRNRVYQQINYAVDPSTGTVGNALTSNSWYDYSGNLIQSIAAGDGQAFSKITYNGVNWVTGSYRGYNPSGTSYSQAATVTGDIIATQSIPTYDEAGNVIATASYDRLNDTPSTGSGSTGALVYATQPKARLSYGAAWVDGLDRMISTANYGAIASFTRPTTPPSSSATVLVSQVAYDDAGRVYQITDPNGVINQTSYDAAGRTTQTLEDVGTGHLNRATNYAYTLDRQIATLTAVNPSTGDQTTTYTYGTTLTDSGVARNDLLISTTYPDSVSGSDVVSYTYNRLGQQITTTDQRGTVHSFYYDLLGRQTNDCVTTDGTGTDVAVKQIARAYEVRGMANLITSTDSATPGSGTVLNQVAMTYNTFGQLSAELQSHSGAVGGSTPYVGYGYDTGGSSSNEVRLNQLLYPNGRAVGYGYGASSGFNDYLNRISAIADSTTLATYTSLGSGMVVRITYPQPSAWLDLWGGTGGTFTGIDRFNRITDQRWQNAITGTPADIDRYQYGYDQNSNRLYKANAVGTAAVTTGLDELYAYDPLNRLTQMQRGVLNSTKTALTGTPAREMDYTLDSTGNWDAYQTATSGTIDLDQTRTQNPVNEITAITAGSGTPLWITPAYDAAGNMTTMPIVNYPEGLFTAVYDAWNRMVGISNSTDNVAFYQYDGRNRRIVKTTVGILGYRHFYYTTSWQNVEERFGTSTTADLQYVWGLRYIDELVCRDDSNFTPTRLYACQDANFNLTAIADTTGMVQERYLFDPYGNRTIRDASWNVISSSAYAWVIGHQGLMHDAESGLVYNRMRYLHQLLGVFTAKDQIGYRYTMNLYSYLGSNTTRYNDPFGLTPTTEPVPSSHTFEDGMLKIEIIPSPNASQARTTITFTPKNGQCKCEQIAFIQVVHEFSANGVRAHQMELGKNLTNEERKTLHDYWSNYDTESGSYLDHTFIPGLGKANSSPFFNANWNPNTNTYKSTDSHGNLGSSSKPATLIDKPAGPDDANLKYRFETFAVCVTTGKILGGIRWGFDVTPVTNGHSHITPWEGSDKDFSTTPSKDWADALDLFNKGGGKQGWQPIAPTGGYGKWGSD